MNDKVYVIADCSGKMYELGKNHLMVYLLITVCNLMPNCELFLWNDNIRSIDSPYIDEKDDFEGKANVKVLHDFLNKLDENERVLLLSDGNFYAADIVKSLRNHKIQLVTLSVGADSSRSTLDSLCMTKKSFGTADINAAINALHRGMAGD